MSRLRLGLAASALVALGAVSAPLIFGPAFADDAPPPSARPGECYGKVLLPPVYGVAHKKVLEKEGWTERKPGREVATKVARKVLVKPARTVRVRKPAVYKTEVSWVTKPGRVRWVEEPAHYKIVREKVLVEPGHAEWRRVDAPLAYGESRGGQTLVQPTGEVVCRVWVPARYAYEERKVLVSPARSHKVKGPPRREKVVRKVKVREAGWTEKRVPAVYRTEYVKTGTRHVPGEVIEHPPVYREVETPTLVRPERDGWARVVCGGAINPAFMVRVQQALIARGFDPGPPDGIGRPQTYDALRMFQRQQRLAQGQLTVESARALGVL
jgi:hypothetical protein